MAESVESQEVKPDNSFFEIKDYEGKILYTTNVDELRDILIQILTLGTYTKTFEVFKDLYYLTYSTISEKERISGYELVRQFTKEHEETSRAIIDTYSKNVNIALQLVRMKIQNNTTQFSQGSTEERIALVEELSEDNVREISKWLMVFATLTSKAFNSEQALKNS